MVEFVGDVGVVTFDVLMDVNISKEEVGADKRDDSLGNHVLVGT